MKNSFLRGLSEKSSVLLNDYGLPANIFLRFFGAYFIVSAYELMTAQGLGLNPVDDWKNFVGYFPLLTKAVQTLLVFLLLSVLYRVLPEKFRFSDSAALIFGSVLFSVLLVFQSENFYLGASVGIVAAVFTVYAVSKISGSLAGLPLLPALTVILLTSVGATVFISATSIASHKIFGTPCFDMGIFVQTFYSLKEHLNAVITCERAEAMSHFRVHSSYILYLLTPIYALFPKAETLLVIQAVFVEAGVVPMYLIAKKRGLSGFELISACALYTLSAGLILPCYFWFHENSLLPALLMWLIYAADRRNIPLFYIMSVLTCSVKEDAPLYVICIALFMFSEEKSFKRWHGIIAAALSAGYFIVIMKWLTVHGDGSYMTSSRLGLLMESPESGFIGIIKNVLSDPGYFFSLFFNEKTVEFVLQTLLPLMFLPLLGKKLNRFLLIIPYVIMNLVIGTGYGYAANIGFQYILGPVCFLIYAALRNACDFSPDRRRLFIAAAAVITVVTTVSTASGKLSNFNYYLDTESLWKSAEECIASVPEDGSVLANTFLLPHAANRDEIYEFNTGCFEKDENGRTTGIKDLEKYDFCVFLKTDEKTSEALPFLMDAGWTVYSESDGIFAVVFVSPEYLQAHPQA